MTESDVTKNTTTGHHEPHHGSTHETKSEGDTHAWHTGDESETHHHENEEKQPKVKETHMNGKNLKTLAGLILTAVITLAAGTTTQAATTSNLSSFDGYNSTGQTRSSLTNCDTADSIWLASSGISSAAGGDTTLAWTTKNVIGGTTWAWTTKNATGGTTWAWTTKTVTGGTTLAWTTKTVTGGTTLAWTTKTVTGGTTWAWTTKNVTGGTTLA